MGRKKDYGNPWLNDPGDEPDFTEHEEFVIMRDTGSKPEDFYDKAKGERFRMWLASNPAESADT